MLIQKYKAKRDFKNKHITIPIYSSINNLESSNKYDDFIQEETNNNINNIIDYDTTLYGNNHTILFSLINFNPTDLFSNSSAGRKSFILMEFYDDYKFSKRNLIFSQYLVIT